MRFTAWPHKRLGQHNWGNYTGARSSSWGTGTRDKNSLGLQHQKFRIAYSANLKFCLYGQLVFVTLKISFSLRATCNLLPLDKNVCLSSSARRWPSFCQVILGEGLPLATQSITATLFTSTVTSSGRSPSAPLMDGGTTKEQNVVRILWFSTSQCFLLFFVVFFFFKITDQSFRLGF